MIENLPLMLQKMTEAKKPEHIRNYLLPLLGKALAQEKQSHLQVKNVFSAFNLTFLGEKS